jgi:RNA polymerase sigma-70 factor (ECF subfamily)
VWLCQIAKNYYFSLYKKNKRLVEYDGGFYEEFFEENFEKKLADKEEAEKIHQALHVLKEPYKEVFSLCIFGELTFDEIAVIFGKNDSWARVTFYLLLMMIIYLQLKKMKMVR